MQQELREAFRLYDKEGNGYITTDVFRDILYELDDKLSPEELDLMIEEIDADGSGTLDFDGLNFFLLTIAKPMLLFYYIILHST
jgi:calmodulin